MIGALSLFGGVPLAVLGQLPEAVPRVSFAVQLPVAGERGALDLLLALKKAEGFCDLPGVRCSAPARSSSLTTTVPVGYLSCMSRAYLEILFASV